MVRVQWQYTGSVRSEEKEGGGGGNYAFRRQFNEKASTSTMPRDMERLSLL